MRTWDSSTVGGPRGLMDHHSTGKSKCSEENLKWRTVEEDTQHQTLASSCTRADTRAHIQAHCTHEHMHPYEKKAA